MLERWMAKPGRRVARSDSSYSKVREIVYVREQGWLNEGDA
jgi:hypothetical protein